jgi:hypothetical protein
MKRLALALLLALAPCALAQEKKDDAKAAKEPVLPFNPLAGAKEGDWTAFKCSMVGPGVSDRRAQAWKVLKVDEKEILVEQSAGDGRAEEVKLPAKEAPTISRFCDIDAEKVEDVKVQDEKKAIAGHAFACKKVTFTTTNGDRKIRATLWLCSDVKGSGVVALHLEMDVVEQQKATVDFELAGYGSTDKTEFGKTKAELAKELKEEKPPEKKDEPKKDEPKKDEKK